MGVIRLGYVHLRATDNSEARKHYEDVLGLKLMHEEPDRLYYKAWDEWDHHHLVLEQGGLGLNKFGFKVTGPEALDEFERKTRQFGCTVMRMSKGENLAVGEGLRVVLPSEHIMELYYDIEYVGTEVGTINPLLRPKHLIGIGVPQLDHMLLSAEDPGLMERFFTECMNFRVSERVVTELGEKGKVIGTWLFATHKTHDIAFINGVNGKFHHIGYKVMDWNAIRIAGEILGMNDVSVGFGPDIHGLSRGQTIYFFDPAGNRNEVFAGGYETFPDWPTMTWTADQLLRAVGHIGREMKENHFTVVT
ncbi:MAG TPA: catechol 2,3-dioxygenase [Alicyclobacillus sp.]|nr:catechol 2,3-dioxygenase [Alicyclobacillus sp.]